MVHPIRPGGMSSYRQVNVRVAHNHMDAFRKFSSGVNTTAIEWLLGHRVVNKPNWAKVWFVETLYLPDAPARLDFQNFPEEVRRPAQPVGFMFSHTTMKSLETMAHQVQWALDYPCSKKLKLHQRKGATVSIARSEHTTPEILASPHSQQA